MEEVNVVLKAHRVQRNRFGGPKTMTPQSRSNLISVGCDNFEIYLSFAPRECRRQQICSSDVRLRKRVADHDNPIYQMNQVLGLAP